jgi:hypothetical protein
MKTLMVIPGVIAALSATPAAAVGYANGGTPRLSFHRVELSDRSTVCIPVASLGRAFVGRCFHLASPPSPNHRPSQSRGPVPRF